MNLKEAINEINQLNRDIREKLEKIKKFEDQYGKIILSGMLEEKKTLSDKIVEINKIDGVCKGWLKKSDSPYMNPELFKLLLFEDVKEALKEFIKEVCHPAFVNDEEIFNQKAKEIFGDDLV